MINIVVNTKGGVGKSTTSSQLLTSSIYSRTSKPVLYFEIDDQNESIKNLASSKIINSSIIKTENIAKFVEDSISFDEDVVVDVGGNLTAVMFLDKLKMLGGFIAPTTYYIPLTDGDQDAINAAETFKKIREYDKDSHIIYVLNRCTNKSNQDLIEREFIDFFGSEILDVTKIIQDKKSSYISLNRNAIYNLAGKLEKTILELALENYDEEYKAAAKEYYKDKTNTKLYKKVRKLMFLKEQTTIAKSIYDDEYKDLFIEIESKQTQS